MLLTGQDQVMSHRDQEAKASTQDYQGDSYTGTGGKGNSLCDEAEYSGTWQAVTSKPLWEANCCSASHTLDPIIQTKNSTKNKIHLVSQDSYVYSEESSLKIYTELVSLHGQRTLKKQVSLERRSGRSQLLAVLETVRRFRKLSECITLNLLFIPK